MPMLFDAAMPRAFAIALYAAYVDMPYAAIIFATLTICLLYAADAAIDARATLMPPRYATCRCHAPHIMLLLCYAIHTAPLPRHMP